MPSLAQWFRSLSFQKQILVLAAVFDPIGALAGYAFHDQLGVEPLIGAVIGLVAASMITSTHVAFTAMSQEGESDQPSG